MLEKLEITKENGEVLSVDIISAFKISNDNGWKIYCLTTANELDQNGLVKILASEVMGDRLVKITDDKEWMNVKNVMRSIISSSPDSYSYVNIAKSFNATVDFARVIAVQDSAKMQLINDYNQKHEAAYELLPEEFWSFQRTVTIPAGEVSAPVINLTIKPFTTPNNEAYAIPVRITSVTGTVGIVGNANHILYLLTSPNKQKTLVLKSGNKTTTVFNSEMP